MRLIETVARAVLGVQRTRSRIADLIDADPDGWQISEYRLTHKAAGVTVWIANGRQHVHLEMIGGGPVVQFSYAEQHLIWAAYSRLKAARQAEQARLDAAKQRQFHAKLSAALDAAFAKINGEG